MNLQPAPLATVVALTIVVSALIAAGNYQTTETPTSSFANNQQFNPTKLTEDFKNQEIALEEPLDPQSTPTNKEQPRAQTPQEEDFLLDWDWKIYQDEDLGVQFQYPGYLSLSSREFHDELYHLGHSAESGDSYEAIFLRFTNTSETAFLSFGFSLRESLGPAHYLYTVKRSATGEIQLEERESRLKPTSGKNIATLFSHDRSDDFPHFFQFAASYPQHTNYDFLPDMKTSVTSITFTD